MNQQVLTESRTFMKNIVIGTEIEMHDGIIMQVVCDWYEGIYSAPIHKFKCLCKKGYTDDYCSYLPGKEYTFNGSYLYLWPVLSQPDDVLKLTDEKNERLRKFRQEGFNLRMSKKL